MDLEAFVPHSVILDVSETQMIPYMATGTAFVTGIATKLPVLVKIKNIIDIQ